MQYESYIESPIRDHIMGAIKALQSYATDYALSTWKKTMSAGL